MNNNNVQSLRRLLNIILFLLFVALSGCASSPEEYEVVTEPVEETAPPAEAVPAPAIVAPAEPIILAPNHPERYVVVRGDTLWDISGRFLRDPWRWPEVWQGNPQVANPHLIFPGDVLQLYIIDGRPVMQVERGGVAIAAGVTDGGTTSPRAAPTDAAGRPLRVVKLSPQVREIDLEKAIPVIPMDAISQFLERSLVVEEGELEEAPYVVSLADEHVAGGTDYRLYARGIEDEEVERYTVVRPGKEYIDPDSGEYLGMEALYLARAQLVREGDPATFKLSSAKREVLKSDRLVAGEPEIFSFSFMPHAPTSEIKGRIISAFDAVNQIGQHQVVVLNMGKREGMEPGHVLAVFKDGESVRDPVRGGKVKLPDERAGTVMIFRTFDRVSYALVMDATRAMNLGDRVLNP